MKSFLQGKSNGGVEPLRPPVQLSASFAPRCEVGRAGPGAAAPGVSNAQVEVVKEGDKVVRLIVNCVCGERVEIECLYSAGR